MTGVEILLLLIGSVFMIGSFFITEKLSPSELHKIAELSESEIRKMIEQELGQAEGRIEEAIDDQLAASTEKVDRALEKETNEKIMAISEYSDTILEGMNKSHNEIMFLYSMLNDKHTELTGMTSNLQRLAADVRGMEEMLQTSAPVLPEPVSAEPPAAIPEPQPEPVEKEPVSVKGPEAEPVSDRTGEVLTMYRDGMSEVEIAKKMNMGVGEVRLVIGLYRGEKDS
ncbi:MAG: hypothetical protein HFI35_10770 [Roseburia sp.]|jgi:uncharacterized protein YneF (UPF0154 family)|nr:hypothetical protein [Roseburia sp.]